MPQVKVSQSDGEIVVAVAGDEPVTYAVKRGQVEVADEHVAAVLAADPGASVAEAPPKSEAAGAPPKET